MTTKKNTIKGVKAWVAKFNKKNSGLSEFCEIQAMEHLNETVGIYVPCNCHKNQRHYASMYTVFPTKKEAIAWISDNDDFEAIPVLITPITKVVKNKVGK